MENGKFADAGQVTAAANFIYEWVSGGHQQHNPQ
jgi:hypothetical protein